VPSIGRLASATRCKRRAHDLSVYVAWSCRETLLLSFLTAFKADMIIATLAEMFRILGRDNFLAASADVLCSPAHVQLGNYPGLKVVAFGALQRPRRNQYGVLRSPLVHWHRLWRRRRRDGRDKQRWAAGQWHRWHSTHAWRWAVGQVCHRRRRQEHGRPRHKAQHGHCGTDANESSAHFGLRQ
jgi:hypothetical protein